MISEAAAKLVENHHNGLKQLRDMVDNESVFKIAHVKKYNNEYTLKFDKKLKVPSLVISHGPLGFAPYRGDYVFIGSDNSVCIEKETGMSSTDYTYIGRGV